MDLESETLMINAAFPKWQSDLISTVGAGMKAGEVFTMTASRGTGKSAFSSAQFQKLWGDIFKAQPLSDLVLDESKVQGARYYTVSPVGGTWADMEAWCKETFGEPGEIWPSQNFAWPEVPRWMQNNRKFWFRNLKDRDWFVMRWRS